MKETPFIWQPRVAGTAALLLAGILGTAVWVWQGLGPRHGGREDRSLEGLQILGTVPDFSLLERGGRRVTLADFRGKVWIASFIYTHCTDTCPLQSARMARLQEDLRAEPDVRLVSITVDPERDTPRVLAEYAARFSADRDRWLFLTGEKMAIYALAQEGFHLPAADPGEAAPSPPERRSQARPPGTTQNSQSHLLGLAWVAVTERLPDAVSRLVGPSPAFAHSDFLAPPFIHSSLFALVDRQARIRGYYPGTDEKALGRLRRDVRVLLREDRP
jgi:cytochrome oxidase Cu insertion factor (SCO1/SenC/PrrC family)